jgi:hypothetical protein
MLWIISMCSHEFLLSKMPLEERFTTGLLKGHLFQAMPEVKSIMFEALALYTEIEECIKYT